LIKIAILQLPGFDLTKQTFDLNMRGLQFDSIKKNHVSMQWKKLGIRSCISLYAQHNRLSTETRVTAVLYAAVTVMSAGTW